MSLKKSELAVEFLSCDLADMGSLFTKGLWACPMVAIDSGQNVLVTLAAISLGSPIRRVESWLDRGGLSDRLSTARRGLRYEAWVREELKGCLARNLLLPDARCATESTRRNSNDIEQIDLLVRVGGILIVGEIKCLLAPIESIEHFNYLSRLNEAGQQAVRKARWISENVSVAAEALSIPVDEAKLLRTVPIVVTNQGAGFGLLAEGARVVDFHFLRLYLAAGEYSTGAAFNLAGKMGASQVHVLYETEQEAARQFERTMADPPTVARFKRFANWGKTTFPRANGENIQIAICNFDDQDDAVAKRLFSLVS